jgi:hypothetical protein
MKFAKSPKNDIVRIAVTKYISKIRHDKLPVNVYFRGFKVDKIIQHDVAQKSSIYEKTDIPEKIYWVKAFVRDNNRGIKLTLHRKAISELSKKAPVRVLFQCTDKGIILRKSDNILRGRKLYSVSKQNNSHVTEIAYPKELRNRFTGFVGIPIYEFGIDADKFSMNETEGKILLEMIKLGLDVRPGSTWTNGDIILPNGGYIEVTNFNPNSRKNSRHTSSVMQIRGKLFEAEHFSIHRNVKPIFIVVNESWAQNKYLQEEIREAQKFSVYALFTNFKNNWEKPIASEIVKKYSSFVK